MPFVNDPKCGRVKVSSKVRVSPPGSVRQRMYCKRSAKIRGNWRSNECSKNAVQRRRWKC